MRRADRAKDKEFALALIDRCEYGVLAPATGADGPYCLPLSLVRVGEVLYFHCAREGKKLELLKRDPRVFVTFVGRTQPALEQSGNYTTYYESAMVSGTAFAVEEDGEKIAALRALCEKLMPDRMELFDRAIEKSLGVTAVWGIRMEEVTGKAKEKK